VGGPLIFGRPELTSFLFSWSCCCLVVARICFFGHYYVFVLSLIFGRLQFLTSIWFSLSGCCLVVVHFFFLTCLCSRVLVMRFFVGVIYVPKAMLYLVMICFFLERFVFMEMVTNVCF
jgi:hypothetical protein